MTAFQGGIILSGDLIKDFSMKLLYTESSQQYEESNEKYQLRELLRVFQMINAELKKLLKVQVTIRKPPTDQEKRALD